MRIALELAQHNPVYEDIATKFFEHFLQIAGAMNNLDGAGVGMWDEEDQFFYDVLHLPHGGVMPLKLRSMVGLIPLFAVETLEPELLEKCRISIAGCGGICDIARNSPRSCRTGTSRAEGIVVCSRCYAGTA
jgi:hypothetical protein